MKCMCQLQLCITIYHHLSFDALFPLPIYDPSLMPRGKSQKSPDAVRSHTKKVDCI